MPGRTFVQKFWSGANLVPFNFDPSAASPPGLMLLRDAGPWSVGWSCSLTLRPQDRFNDPLTRMIGGWFLPGSTRRFLGYVSDSERSLFRTRRIVRGSLVINAPARWRWDGHLSADGDPSTASGFRPRCLCCLAVAHPAGVRFLSVVMSYFDDLIDASLIQRGVIGARKNRPDVVKLAHQASRWSCYAGRWSRTMANRRLWWRWTWRSPPTLITMVVMTLCTQDGQAVYLARWKDFAVRSVVADRCAGRSCPGKVRQGNG